MKLFVTLLAAGALAYEPTADVIGGTDTCKSVDDLQECILGLITKKTSFTYTHTGDGFKSTVVAGCASKNDTRTLVYGDLKPYEISDLTGALKKDFSPTQFLVTNIPAAKKEGCKPVAYVADASNECPDAKTTTITIGEP
ncbi:hypothetical protein GNI_200350, partial [Gregarina niphandrodes]